MNGYPVELQESGPLQPLPFQEGDVLGIHLTNLNSANFVPYLYNSSEVGRKEHLSYFVPRFNIRDQVINIHGRTPDTLVPLIALATCDSSVEDMNDPMYCNGCTLFNNSICKELIMNTQPIEPPTGDPSIGVEVLVLAITIPVASVLFILVIVMVIFVCLCIHCIRMSKRRQHAMYNEEFAMENMSGRSSSVNRLNTSADHPQEFSGGVYKRTSTPDSYYKGNGAVANYEDPVSLSQSQESMMHIQDTCKHRDIVFASTPSPPFTPSSSPQSHCSHPHSPQTPGSVYYHSLELPKGTEPITSSLVISTIAGQDIGSSSPNSSLPRPLIQPSLVETSADPRPRHRLKSMPNTGTRVHPNGPPRPQSEQGHASLRTYGPTFKLETGVYVPTKNQMSELSTDPRENIFDDSLYDFLGQAADNPSDNNWAFFEETDKYWSPASSTANLYQQLANRKYREIIRKQIQIVSHLGSGEFGTVCKGLWNTEQGEFEVAVKMLSSKSSEEETVRFLQEAAIMGQFRHPNIVRLHGVVTMGEPVMIVLELVGNGDLRKHLRTLRASQPIEDTLPQLLVNFSSQIALGMEYLARKEFVHRDLAARNILLTDDFVCKIADFGLSRDLEDEEFYVSNGGKIPVKWTAPEAIHYRKYSTASDVWSFGVLLYEIWSLGSSPFKNKSPEETMSLVDSGNRLPPPPGCPKAIYELMIECWHPDAQDRPNFTELVTCLSQSHSTLLKWSQDDLTIHSQVSILGSMLSLGEQLYPELQSMYSS